MQFQLDPTAPNGVSKAPEPQRVVTKGGYAGSPDITRVLQPGTGVTFTGSGTQQSPYVINSSGGSGTPAGNSGDIQFNSAGSFGGDDNFYYDSTNVRVGIGTNAPTHSLTLASTSTGTAFYNSSDQTTNFERATVGFVANTFTIATSNGGTGTLRPMTINGGSSFVTLTGIGVSFGRGSTGNASIVTAQATFTSSSIVQNLMVVQPTLTQTGTAGYTALLVNPLITTVGSGAQLLADFQRSGTSRLRILDSGIFVQSANGATSGGLTLYNTTDEVTNFERLRMFSLTNTWTFESSAGGTGTIRNIVFTNGSNTFTQGNGSAAYQLSRANTAIQTLAQVTSTGLTGTSLQQGLLLDPTITQTAAGAYTVLDINPTESTTGSGVKLLANFRVGGTSKASFDNTGSLNLSTTANEYNYNLGDPTATNYERVRSGWVSNVFQLVTEIGGTGLGRNLVIGTVNRRLAIVESPSSSGIFQFAASTSVVGAVGVVVNGTMTQSSGSVTPLAVTATMQQTGTAGYTGFLVNINETTIGNGSKLLADFQVGGTTKASIDSIGVVKAFGYSTVFANRVTTTNLSAGSSAANYCDATTAAFTITLPTPTSTSGVAFMIKKTDASANAVTIATAAGTIDGAATYSLTTQYKYIVVRSNGSNWFIEGNN